MAPLHSLPSQEKNLPEDRNCGFDDLVPGHAGSGVCGDGEHAPHETEYIVQRALLNLPDVHFSSLQVHRMPNGVCLTGVVKVPEEVSRPQFGQVAGAAAGIAQVLDRLVVQRELGAPEKTARRDLREEPSKKLRGSESPRH